MSKFKAITIPWLIWIYGGLATYGLISLLFVPFTALHLWCKDLRDQHRWLRSWSPA